MNTSKDGSFYALSWYLNIVSPNWDGIVSLIDGEYHDVFPLTLVKKFNIKILKKPILTYQLGLISLDPGKRNITDLIQFLTKKLVLVQDYFLNAKNGVDFRLENHKLKFKTIDNYVLKLNQPYLDIYRRYCANRKRDLKKAFKAGLRIESFLDIDEFLNCYSEITQQKIPGFKGEKYECVLIRKVYNECIEKNMVFLMAVKDDNNLIIAGGMFIKYKRRITYLLGFSNEEGRKQRAMPLLLDHFIKKSFEFEELDFAGSNIASLATFFERFGAVKESFVCINFNNLPKYVALLQKARKVFKRW